MVNLEKLWSLVGEEALKAAAQDSSAAPVIDVTQHGYFKVRGGAGARVPPAGRPHQDSVSPAPL